MAMHCLCENLFLLNSLSFPSLGIRHGNRSSFISVVKAISSSQPPPASSFSRSKFSVFAVAEASEVKAVAPVALDGLIMNLKVEGTLNDSLIPKVTEALKKIQGISNLKVYSSEGVATVELLKQTNIQATGEASSLLETLQGEGFKLQNLSICFDDPGADGDDDIAYE